MISFTVRLFKRDNGIYYIEARRGVWRSLHTRDEIEARRTYKELLREAVKGKLIVLENKCTLTLKEFFDEYLKWVSGNRSINTHETVIFAYKKLLPAVGDKALASIFKKDLDRYVDFCRAKGNTPVTINVGIRTLKAAMSKALEWGYIKDNPWRGYKQIKHHGKAPAFIEDPESIAKLMDAVKGNERHTLLLALLCYTGARRSEVCRLEWRDVTRTHVIFRKRKNYKELTVPISSQLKAILEPLRKDLGRVVGITPNQATHIVKEALRACGMGHLRLHDLRHTFASQLIMNGASLADVKSLLGHSNIQTTMIYAHLTDEAKKEAIGKLPY